MQRSSAGWVATSLLLAACVPVPNARDEASQTFASDHYCPVERTEASEVDRTPPAPAAIARDAERTEMWRRAHAAHGRDDIDVVGCDEHGHYTCWTETSRVPMRRSRGYHTVVRTVCLERVIASG
jgi:hypothetical protein